MSQNPVGFIIYDTVITYENNRGSENLGLEDFKLESQSTTIW